MGFPGDSDGKEPACNAGDPRFASWVRKICWRREWLLTPVLLPEEVHGQRSLQATVHGVQRFGHKWVTNTFKSFGWGWNWYFLLSGPGVTGPKHPVIYTVSSSGSSSLSELDEHLRLTSCTQGQPLHRGCSDYKQLSPGKWLYHEGNNNSMVTRWKIKGKRN